MNFLLIQKAITQLLKEVKKREELSLNHPDSPSYLKPPYGRLPLPTPLISRKEFLELQDKGYLSITNKFELNNHNCIFF